MEDTTAPQKPRFYLTSESKLFLKETAKWAYLLSIFGFIGIIFLIILAFYMGIIFFKLDTMEGTIGPTTGNEGLMTTVYLIMAVIYSFPVFYLFQFATRAKKSFKTNNNDLLNDSFQYLKSHYKFIGILTVVLTLLYIFAGIFWLISQKY